MHFHVVGGEEIPLSLWQDSLALRDPANDFCLGSIMRCYFAFKIGEVLHTLPARLHSTNTSPSCRLLTASIFVFAVFGIMS